MPSIQLHITPSHEPANPTSPFPNLISTPSGLAILEIQGTIHAPFPPPSEHSPDSPSTLTPVGHLDFPDYDPASPDDTKWTKKIYFYVGEHQRLVGELKKLAKPIAVLRKRSGHETDEEPSARERTGEQLEHEVLEIAEVVKYKIVFGSRPEPV